MMMNKRGTIRTLETWSTKSSNRPNSIRIYTSIIGILSKLSTWRKGKVEAVLEAKVLMSIGSSLSLKYSLMTLKSETKNSTEKKLILWI